MIKSIITKADIILALMLACLCAALCVFVYGTGRTGSMVEVRVDGSLYGSYRLDADQTIDIDRGDNHNRLVISEGRAYMSEASCPDGYCMDQYRSIGGISQSNQTIVCLPNKVVVCVKGSSDYDDSEADGKIPDAVTGGPEIGTQVN